MAHSNDGEVVVDAKGVDELGTSFEVICLLRVWQVVPREALLKFRVDFVVWQRYHHLSLGYAWRKGMIASVFATFLGRYGSGFFCIFTSVLFLTRGELLGV